MISFYCLLARRKRHRVSYKTWTSNGSGLSLNDLCWSQQRSNRNISGCVFLSWPHRGVDLNELYVLHSAERWCLGLSLTLQCPILSDPQWILVSVLSWTEQWAGETPSLERLTGWPLRSLPAMKILMLLTTSRYLNKHPPTHLYVITDVIFAKSSTFTSKAGKKLRQHLPEFAMRVVIVNIWNRYLV